MTDKLSEGQLLERLERMVRPAMDYLKYWENNDEQAYQQIKKMIQKPPVTEEWIEEKAGKLILIIQRMITKDVYNPDENRRELKDFIRSLVKDI